MRSCRLWILLPPGPFLSALLPSAVLVEPARVRHGVIREYAALAPKPDAVPLTALVDAPLTDTSDDPVIRPMTNP